MLARNTCIVLNIIVGLILLISWLTQLVTVRLPAIQLGPDAMNHSSHTAAMVVLAVAFILLAAPIVSLIALFKPACRWAKVAAAILQPILLLIAAIAMAMTISDTVLMPAMSNGPYTFPLLTFLSHGLCLATSAGTIPWVVHATIRGEGHSCRTGAAKSWG